jgi:carbon storage regulator
MLVLSRKAGESITLGDHIRITIVKLDKHQVRLGIDAPRSVSVLREEIRPLAERLPVAEAVVAC